MYNWLQNLWSRDISLEEYLPDNFDSNAMFTGNISDIYGGDSLKDIIVDKSQQLYYVGLIIGSVYLYKILK